MVGRQPIEGSKKRPKLKSLVIITRESTNTPHAQILKVGIDCNIFEIVANYTPVLVQDLYPQQQRNDHKCEPIEAIIDECCGHTSRKVRDTIPDRVVPSFVDAIRGEESPHIKS
ncbi:hypothetical protein AAZX31_08G333400 [Glycine max]|nr:hypothetical protein GYH30_023318 [Glycine max]